MGVSTATGTVLVCGARYSGSVSINHMLIVF